MAATAIGDKNFFEKLKPRAIRLSIERVGRLIDGFRAQALAAIRIHEFDPEHRGGASKLALTKWLQFD